ncbi:PREDICTED: pre-mRNA-splicing factor SYF1, partial [Chaetura pelagica]|uniref:pre-mRNA-splicing factor SYF1 n=1 Tax=Chaetura pelagica TaxID=8897 RepID=UPI0005232DB6
LSPESAEEYVRYLVGAGRLDEAAQRLAVPCPQARDVYEEAVQTVVTVRDFTQVFDSYAQFEESLIAARMETAAELGRGEDEEGQLELRLARFGALMSRRPLLLNSVLLRQNPHNVHEWHKRVQLYQGRPEQIIQTYTEAVRTVDPQRATGRPHGLWVAFARFYEDNGQLDDARAILTRATRVRFRRVEDLAAIWCEFGEMELRHHNYSQALGVLRKATALPARRAEYFDASEPVQNRLYKSLKVWSMLADLEESLGTFQSTKAVYDRILDLRIATPQIVINYALFLEEHGYFEESFKELGDDAARELCLRFADMEARLGEVDRARAIYTYCSQICDPRCPLCPQPSTCLSPVSPAIYLLYAGLEERFGLARHAMGVYERATRGVPPEQRGDMFNIYIKRAAELYGVTHTRPIYQKAIEITGTFWQTWKDFEIRHGNEDTIREMLRIKRSVQATYNTQVNFMASQMLKVYSNATGTVSDLAPGQSGLDDMKLLEQRAEALAAEAQRDQPPSKGKVLFV